MSKSVKIIIAVVGIVLCLGALFVYLTENKCARLIDAIRAQDTELINSLIAKGAPCNCVKIELPPVPLLDGEVLRPTSPLVEAIRYQDAATVEMLLANGADPNQSPGTLPPLYYALRIGSHHPTLWDLGLNRPIISMLIHDKVNPYIMVDHGTFLIQETYYPDMTAYGYQLLRSQRSLPSGEVVAALLAQTDMLFDRFHYDYFKGLESLIEIDDAYKELYLLIYKDDVDAINEFFNSNSLHVSAYSLHGWTPAAWAAINGASKCLQFLMELCVDSESCVTESSVSPLLAAVHAGSMESAKLVMKREWLDYPDDQGATPLWAAVRNKDLAMTAMLLDAGANPEMGQIGEQSTQVLLSEWRAEDSGMPF